MKIIKDKNGKLLNIGEWNSEVSLPDGAYEEEVEDNFLEKYKVQQLTCTKRVFALALQELGVSYTQLKNLISSNEQAQLEWDLCVELQRNNPLLDTMAEKLNITPEQIDNIFKSVNSEVFND